MLCRHLVLPAQHTRAQQSSRQEAQRDAQVSQHLVPGRKRAVGQGPDRVTAAPQLNVLSPNAEMDTCCRTTELGPGDLSTTSAGKIQSSAASLFPCLFLYLSAPSNGFVEKADEEVE